jgi:hypothetical protein
MSSTDIPLLTSRAEIARAHWPPLPFKPLDLGEKPRILLLKLSAIGDCLVASPLARALRERYPGAHLVWLVQDKAALVVQGNSFVDEVLVWRGGWRSTLSMMREVRRRRFDAVIDVQGAWKSAPFSFASRAKYRAVSSRADFPARRAANFDRAHSRHAAARARTIPARRFGVRYRFRCVAHAAFHSSNRCAGVGGALARRKQRRRKPIGGAQPRRGARHQTVAARAIRQTRRLVA